MSGPSDQRRFAGGHAASIWESSYGYGAWSLESEASLGMPMRQQSRNALGMAPLRRASSLGEPRSCWRRHWGKLGVPRRPRMGKFG